MSAPAARRPAPTAVAPGREVPHAEWDVNGLRPQRRLRPGAQPGWFTLGWDHCVDAPSEVVAAYGQRFATVRLWAVTFVDYDDEDYCHRGVRFLVAGDITDVREALAAALADYCATPEGRDAVEENGWEEGISFTDVAWDVPVAFLHAHGLVPLDAQAITTEPGLVPSDCAYVPPPPEVPEESGSPAPADRGTDR